MKALDILIMVLLIWGAYTGFKKGFISELFSLGSFFLATIGSIKMLDFLSGIYKKFYGSLGTVTPYIIFVLSFILIIIAVTLTGRFIRYLINMTILGGFDKLMGAILGIFKWAFFISTFLWLGNLLQLSFYHNSLSKSLFFPILQPIAPRLLGWAINCLPILKNWNHSLSLPSQHLIKS